MEANYFKEKMQREEMEIKILQKEENDLEMLMENFHIRYPFIFFSSGQYS